MRRCCDDHDSIVRVLSAPALQSSSMALSAFSEKYCAMRSRMSRSSFSFFTAAMLSRICIWYVLNTCGISFFRCVVGFPVAKVVIFGESAK